MNDTNNFVEVAVAAIPGILLVALVAVMAFNYKKLRHYPFVGAPLYLLYLFVFLAMVIWQGSVLHAGADASSNGPHSQQFFMVFVTEMLCVIGCIMLVAFKSDRK